MALGGDRPPIADSFKLHAEFLSETSFNKVPLPATSDSRAVKAVWDEHLQPAVDKLGDLAIAGSGAEVFTHLKSISTLLQGLARSGELTIDEAKTIMSFIFRKYQDVFEKRNTSTPDTGAPTPPGTGSRGPVTPDGPPRTPDISRPESEFSDYPFLRKFLVKYCDVPYERAREMEKKEIIDVVWSWVITAISYQTIEASASLATVDITKVEYADIQPGITLHKILQDIGSSEAQALFDQINGYVWAVNAGYQKIHPQPKKLDEYTTNPETATEYYRLKTVLGQMYDPIIVHRNRSYPELKPGEKPPRVGVPLGELVRQGIKFTVERVLINQYLEKLKKDKAKAPDGYTQKASPYTNEAQWRDDLRSYYLEQLTTDDDIRNLLKDSSIIDALPRLVFNVMENLYFRALFDFGALKIDPDVSDHVQLVQSRGKVIMTEPQPIMGGKHFVLGRSIRGGPGRYELTAPNYIRTYLPPATKYLQVFEAFDKGSDTELAEDVDIKLREYGEIIGLEEAQLNELTALIKRKSGERKTLLQWILDEDMPAPLIPIDTSRYGFKPSKEKNNTGWPIDYTTIEGNVTRHADSMRTVAYKGIGAEGSQKIDWKKMLRLERRNNGTKYASIEQDVAVVGTKNWRDVWYYFANDNTFQVTKEVYDYYRDFWFSKDSEKRILAQQYSFPFPLRTFTRNPDTGEISNPENPEASYALTMIPVQMYHFFNEDELKKMLQRKEITHYQYDLYKSHWPRIISDQTEDQFLEMLKCMYEIQLVAELRDIPDEEWTRFHADAVMQFLSYEVWYSATRTPLEAVSDFRSGRATTLDLARSLVLAKRDRRISNPIIERFSPSVEDRRYNGLGFWSRQEAVNILKAAGKAFLRDEEKK
jgi:hypothetical protein